MCICVSACLLYLSKLSIKVTKAALNIFSTRNSSNDQFLVMKSIFICILSKETVVSLGIWVVVFIVEDVYIETLQF